MYKKLLKCIVLIFILSSLTAKIAFAEVILYEAKTTDIVSKGVIRENIKRFTSEGWLNINVLRVDLTDPYIKLDTIFSKEGVSKRSTVLQMAIDNHAISAINGDFFSPKPNTNLAHSIGPIIQNGKLISTFSSSENNNVFGVFALDLNNKPYYLYWNNKITLTAPNGKSMPINDINKFGWYTNLYMYDRNWGPKTVGKSDTFPTLTEMVVVENKVKSFSIASGPIDIPENGVVIAGDFEAGEFLKNNFKIGDPVKIDIITVPNLKYLKTAIGGGAFLVKNGQIPPFSHEISGLHPRTALGTTKDDKQAILVTVDGRQLASKGMTQLQLANLMIELGAYNAINLDGGGSTTMVSRELGSEKLYIVNKCSDSNPRPVINSIGVFSNAPKGNLSGIKVKTDDTNIFKNSSRAFYVVGYDNNYNPIKVDQQKVKWSAEGISGKFIDNYFYPSSSGEGKVVAQIDNLTASIDIKVLDSPVELQIYPETITPLQKQQLKVIGKDKYGYKATLYLRNLNISPKNAVTITDDSILVDNNTQYVKLSFDKVYSYLPVIQNNILLDDFEQNTNEFWGYPSTVKGKYSISNKYVKSGNYSGKLEFDFSNTDATKAAYIKFKGYKIDTRPQSLKVWVYSPQKYPHSIKAEFVDSNNNIFRTTFVSNIDWTEWKELETTFPSNITFPVTLRKIYVVQTNSEIKDKGEIYFDKLEVIYSNKKIIIPPSKKIKDFQQVNSSLAQSNNSYRIAVYGSNKKIPSALFNKAIEKMNKDVSYIAFIDKTNNTNIKIPYIENPNSFSVSEFKNSRFITISAKGTNSIREKDYTQWLSLYEALKNNNKDNVFILLDTPISQFNDSLEKELFEKTLSNYVKQTNKNVWVLFSSDKTTVINEDGVKYIGISDKFSIKYLCITVNDKEITYYFNKVY